jgi:mRNA interferase RelE/StbE
VSRRGRDLEDARTALKEAEEKGATPSGTSFAGWETDAWSIEVELTPAAKRDIRKLDPHVRKLVNADLLRLEENPRPQGVERLATKEKLYRVYARPGKNYRVIYQIQDEALLVLVVRVGDRKRSPPFRLDDQTNQKDQCREGVVSPVLEK